MMSKRERRFLQSDVNVEQGASPKISGYGAVFNRQSHDLGGFIEVVDPKAFDKCLAKNPDVKGLINHDENLVLGRTKAGTMRLSVDDYGLRYEIDPPKTSYANDLMVSLGRKDIDGASFGFYTLKDAWSYDKKTGQNVRTLLEVDVFDCSVCLNGAYPDASSQVRSLFPDNQGAIPEEITSKLVELRNQSRKEKRYKSVLSAVAGTKWAILPEKLETICGVLNQRAEGQMASKEEIQAALMGYEQGDMAEESNSSPVAVIPIYGTIGQKMNMMTEFSGGCSCVGLAKSFRTALADDSITSIVFDIDSPGGTVTGVPELAAEILAARGKKPIVAVANGMAGSAAVWIASAADKFVVIPSGEVGSIGVYTVHQDISAAMDKAGVKMTFIQAGKYKTDGNPYQAPSAEFLSDAQQGVDEFYEMFVAAVAAGRGVSADKVKSDFGQGRMLMAKDALAVGLVDSIQTLEQVVAGLSASSSATAVFAQSANAIAQDSAVRSENMENDGIDPAFCVCPCDSCVDGNCGSCLDEDCDWEDGDEGCDCGLIDGEEEDEVLDDEVDDFDEDDDEFGDSFITTLEVQPVVASAVVAAKEKKTKKVDGEDLEKSAFAYQGSPEPADWHLPIEFSTDEKSASHVRDAISRWDQTDMPNKKEKARARIRIKAAAKKHGIDLAPTDLALGARHFKVTINESGEKSPVELTPQDLAEVEANLNTALKVKLMSL